MGLEAEARNWVKGTNAKPKPPKLPRLMDLQHLLSQMDNEAIAEACELDQGSVAHVFHELQRRGYPRLVG